MDECEESENSDRITTHQDRNVNGNLDSEEAFQQIYSWKVLAKLSAVAAVKEAIAPAAGLAELVIVAHSLKSEHDQKIGLAAYTAVTTVTSFVLNIFNFVVVVNMSGVSKAVGAERWAETAKRVQLAFVVAVIVGCFCSLLLISTEKMIYELYDLESEVRSHATAFFELRALSIPFQLLTRTASGILGGFQKLHLVTVANIILSVCLVLSNLASLSLLDKGLHGCALGTLIVYALAAGILSLLVWWNPPHPGVDICLAPYAEEFEEDLEHSHLTHERQGEGNLSPTLEEPLIEQSILASDMSISGESTFSIFQFIRGASNMMIRSFLLSGSLWLMAVVASRLGTSEFAAHGISVQLWTLTSYIVDGFADVGTMVGGLLLGKGETSTIKVVFKRLVWMAVGTGTAFALGFISLEKVIVHGFTSDLDTIHHLETLWPLLSFMQVVNSLVFVYDGLIYATHRFDIIRNIMLIGALLWFCPALFAFNIAFHSLFAIWFVKAVLNTWRAISAIYVMHALFFPVW